jgi:CheY-like chemotaxis protein
MDAKPLILIVDDEPEIVKLYSRKLEKMGYDVISAENGLLGVEAALGQRRPDLILLDLKMPIMDGAEAFMKLKEHPATKDIKIVFLTAFSDLRVPEFDAKIAQQVGASDFIKKGIDLDEFGGRVKQLLEQH